jgi:iron uptake system component EfeO
MKVTINFKISLEVPMRNSKAQIPVSVVALWATGVILTSCGSDPKTEPRQQALSTVTSYISANLATLQDAAMKLRAAAPAPDDDGWNETADAGAVETMRIEWKRARSYERVEGAIAVLFPEFDVSSDDRYEGFLADNGADVNLFDDQNVTGVHAIERILWSNHVSPSVRTFEATLTGYVPAAFPATRQQADDFKNKLCARLIDDVRSVRSQFAALMVDDVAAFRGVAGSMGEQIEKVEKAATGEEESRYAQYTLADMRINVDAGVHIFAAFEPWLRSKMANAQIDAIAAAFARVQAAYARLPGDAIPPIPASWNSAQPGAADLATAYGTLWTVLQTEADPMSPGGLVSELGKAAEILGIPELSP